MGALSVSSDEYLLVPSSDIWTCHADLLAVVTRLSGKLNRALNGGIFRSSASKLTARVSTLLNSGSGG